METVVCNWICGALPRAAQLLWGRLRNRMSCEITGTQARHCAHQTTVRAAITCLERNKSLKLEMTAPSKHHPETWGSSSTCRWSVADLKLIHSVFFLVSESDGRSSGVRQAKLRLPLAVQRKLLTTAKGSKGWRDELKLHFQNSNFRAAGNAALLCSPQGLLLC